jgi:uncharacterized protein YdhG (YjbR/CyaY superfamily)
MMDMRYDGYHMSHSINQFPPSATIYRRSLIRLEQIQHEVERQIPECERTISYNLPAFKKGNTFFYFGAFKKHIGIYPPVTEDLDLIRETQALRGPKGNLSFSHDSELPLELIGRVAKALASQYSAA